MFSFIDIRLIDIIDILACAYIMYIIYKLIKGTVALSIVVSIFAFLVVWFVVRALNMSMLSGIMDSFVNIGLLALIIIFQQEVRQFLIMAATKRTGIFKKYFTDKLADEQTDFEFANAISRSCENMSKSKTGALIVIQKSVGLKEFIETGEELSAKFSSQLIETIFFKNTPLHDGAMIVNRKKIIAAGCILPVSHNMEIPKSFGLRHRSALGITELTDAVSIVVSEETGRITVFDQGVYVHYDSADQLNEFLVQFL